MDVSHPGVLDSRGQLALRETGPAGYRPVAHIEQHSDAGFGKSGEHVLLASLLVSDREEPLTCHSPR